MRYLFIIIGVLYILAYRFSWITEEMIIVRNPIIIWSITLIVVGLLIYILYKIIKS